jgi:hypothetical protein
MTSARESFEISFEMRKDGQFEHLGAQRGELGGEHGRLLARAGDNDAASGKRLGG